MIKEKDFYRNLLAVALPIVLQNLMTSSLSFLDTLMIGQIGSVQIAAVGVANQIFFLVNLFIFGIASGASIFFAQYYGARQNEELEKVMGLGFTVSVAGSLIWAVVSLLFPEWIMHIFTDDPLAVSTGAEYQRIVAVSYVFFAVSMIHGFAYRSTGKASLPLKASFVSLVTNAIGNYLLIFGIGPFPMLGAAGAAISTALSRLIEMLLLLYWTYSHKEAFRIRSRNAFRWKGGFIKVYMKTSLPVLCNEMLWALGMTTYKVAYSKLGIDTLAAVNVAEAISNFFFIASMGIGNASTIVLGQTIGSGALDKARNDARGILRLSFFIGVVMGGLLALFAQLFVSWFNIDPEIMSIAQKTLYVIALFQPLKSMNMILFVGILRSGGDTRYALIGETSCVWFVGVPMAFLGSALLSLPLYQVYLMVNLEEVCKIIVSYPRYRSQKWIKVLTNS